MLDALELISPILPALIYWHNKEGIVLGANEQCLKELGVTAEFLIGKNPYDFYPKNVAEHILKHNDKVMSSKQILSQEEVTKNFETGKLKHYISIKSPLYDDEGAVIGIIGTSVDITAEKEAEQLRAEIEKHEAVEDKNKLFKDFTTQLMGVINNFQILNDTGKSELNLVDTDIKLTKRETEVLYFLSRGKKPKDIGTKLGISHKTVQNIIDGKLFPKLGTPNIGDLIEKAQRLNLIPFTLEL